jgi:hypothetical protein
MFYYIYEKYNNSVSTLFVWNELDLELRSIKIMCFIIS